MNLGVSGCRRVVPETRCHGAKIRAGSLAVAEHPRRPAVVAEREPDPAHSVPQDPSSEEAGHALLPEESLTWQPLSADAVPAWHALLEAVVAEDGGAEHLSPEDLRDELTPSWIDLARDSVIGLDADRVARAFGLVQLRPGDVTSLRVHCWGGVHPQWRERGIGRRLLAWQESRAQALVAARRAEIGDVPARAFVGVEEGAERAARLVERAGFVSARWYWTMRRDLSNPIPPADVPQPLHIVPFTPDLDDPIRLAHNDAFEHHFGFQPWDPDAWRQWETGHRDFRGDWSFAVLDGAEVAGYALSAGYPSEWEAEGVTEGWTGKLGVRARWRGRGLAKALLAASMRAFAASGMQYAGLDVDSDNPTGAVALYTGLGYQVRHRSAMWTKDL